MLENLAQDLRYAIRMLSRSPGFTAAAALSLALGIGANTAIFSLIDAVLLRHLPVANPARLVAIGNQERTNSLSQGSARADLYSQPFFREIEKQQSVLTGMYATGRTGQVVEGSADSGRHPSARLVSHGYFDVLGVRPQLGRVFTWNDSDVPGAFPAVVIGFDYWQQSFHGRASVVGSRIVLNGYPFTIIGVAPRDFFGDIVGQKTDIWVPLAMQAQLMPGYNFRNDWNSDWLLLMGRLKPRVSFGEARAQLTALTKRILIAHAGPKISARELREYREATVPIVPGLTGFSRMRRDFSVSLMMLMSLVGVVLLIACGNMANLLLARATTRRREIAIRLAIGAGRGRVLWQLVDESLLLSLAGGVLGLMVAFWASQGLLILASDNKKPIPLNISPDARILLFTFAVALVTGLLFGLAPSLRAARIEVAPALRETARSLAGRGARASAGRMLVIAQVALSVLLVFGAGLFVRTLRNLETEDMGFARSHLLMLELDPISSGYKQARLPALCLAVMDRLRTLPGVEAATFSENGIFSGTEGGERIEIPGYTPKSDSDMEVAVDRVGPGYFASIGAKLLVGRGIEARDTPGAAPVVTINEAMARHFFPGRNPVGRQFKIGDHVVTIVGVARDVHDHSVRDAVVPRMYSAFAQHFDDLSAFNFEIRTSGDPAALTNSVRSAVHDIDPGLRIFKVAPVDEQIGETLSDDRLVARLSALFGAVALALAAFGLYGVLSYNVARRASEIGIRMALGASRAGVVWMVLGEALQLALIGIAIGVPAAIAAGRLISSHLFGLAPYDPLTLAGAALIMVAVAAFASWLPASRAAGVDPMLALRYE